MKQRRMFRWLGGKGHVVADVAPGIRAHLEMTKGKLVSLFYGSGAIEQAVGGSQVVAEKSEDLRALYAELLEAPRDLFELLRDMAGTEPRDAAWFLRWRSAAPRSRRDRAVRFLILSHCGFNGLWRLNKRGEPNMSRDPARLAKPWPFPSLADFEAASLALVDVEFVEDWTQALALATPGDVVLSDPPYMGGFTDYTPGGFPDEEQWHLAEELRRAEDNGCAIVAFNSPAAAPLYSWVDTIHVIHRRARVGGQRVREIEPETMFTHGIDFRRKEAA